jgi:hypothetical protein
MTQLCKGDKVKLHRCGTNAKERMATVAYANNHEFIPVVRLLWFLPWPRFPMMGVWRLQDEGTTWSKWASTG